MFNHKTHSINLRTSGTHSLFSLMLIPPDMACTHYPTMEVNYGTPSPIPPGHCQSLPNTYRSLPTVKAPEYITNMFNHKTHSINLCTSGTYSLVIPHVNTTRYGLHSLSYYGSKLWNSLPNTTRSLPTVKAFKSSIRNLDFDADCCPFCR